MWLYWSSIWELQHKVTFDGVNRHIIIAAGVTDIDIAKDIYSDWKEWLLYYNNTTYRKAITAVGGNALPGGDALGSTFFLINNWKIVISEGTTFVGNIYSDDGSSPFITKDGVQLSTNKVSNLSVAIAPNLSGLSFPTSDEISDAIWNKQIAELLTAGSTGERLKKLLSLQKYMGLK